MPCFAFVCSFNNRVFLFTSMFLLLFATLQCRRSDLGTPTSKSDTVREGTAETVTTLDELHDRESDSRPGARFLQLRDCPAVAEQSVELSVLAAKERRICGRRSKTLKKLVGPASGTGNAAGPPERFLQQSATRTAQSPFGYCKRP